MIRLWRKGLLVQIMKHAIECPKQKGKKDVTRQVCTLSDPPLALISSRSQYLN